MAIGPNLTLIGTLQQQLGQSKEALATHTEALRYARKYAGPTEQAAALHQLGLAHHDLEQFDEAMDCYQKSVKLADPRRAGPTHNNIGLIHQIRHQSTEALGAFEQAIALFEQYPDPPQQAVCLSNAAEVLAELGRKEQAAEALGKAVAILRRIQHPGAATFQHKLDALTGNAAGDGQSR